MNKHLPSASWINQPFFLLFLRTAWFFPTTFSCQFALTLILCLHPLLSPLSPSPSLGLFPFLILSFYLPLLLTLTSFSIYLSIQIFQFLYQHLTFSLTSFSFHFISHYSLVVLFSSTSALSHFLSHCSSFSWTSYSFLASFDILYL